MAEDALRHDGVDGTDAMSALSDLQTWVGRTEVRRDRFTERPLQGWAATLDERDPATVTGHTLPPCWHWLYFPPLYRQSELGADGHARLGEFHPPVPLPRRMWAGSRLEFLRAPRLGDTITKTTRITAIDGKQGRDGPLLFIRLHHEVATTGGLLVVEAQDIVYRGGAPIAGSARTGTPAPEECDWAIERQPDELLLFRYSALTFNSHRIHYDYRYATAVEGYPGLVVHGPLIAMLLLEGLSANVAGARVARFTFRAVRPAFAGSILHVCGRRAGGNEVHLWAHHEGMLVMDATAVLQ